MHYRVMVQLSVCHICVDHNEIRLPQNLCQNFHKVKVKKVLKDDTYLSYATWIFTYCSIFLFLFLSLFLTFFLFVCLFLYFLRFFFLFFFLFLLLNFFLLCFFVSFFLTFLLNCNGFISSHLMLSH